MRLLIGLLILILVVGLRARAKTRAEYAENERVCREQREKQLGITPLSSRNQKRAA